MKKKPSLSFLLFTNRLLLLVTLTILIASCGDTTIIEAAPGSTSELESSSSESGLYSSSSSIGISSSSSDKTSYSSSSAYVSFYGETGKVCDEWEIKVVLATQATQAYLSMVQVCGVQEILNTGRTPSFNIGHWILETAPLTDEVKSPVVKDINAYGLSFRTFIADDGSIHYVYVEPYNDGMGLK